MTLEELKLKVPSALQPTVDEYGPALVAMTTDEVFAWLDRLARGDDYGAYSALLQKMPTQERLGEWGKLDAEWKAANAANSQRMKLQRDAMNAVLRAVLTVALAMVGL